MSNPKERHYWAQLRSALTAGQWRSPYPARAPNGEPLSWPELFRKFNKHCKGFKDVSEVASQTQALALLVGARFVDDDEDGEMDGMADAGEEGEALIGGKDEGWRRGILGLEDECVLPEERIEEATVGYEILKSLHSSNFDTIHLALAYYAFALRNPVGCISHLEKVPQLLQFQDHIPGTTPPTTASSLRSSTPGLLSPNTYAVSTTSFAGSFASSASLLDVTVPEVRDGRGWALAETFRSLCLQGMSAELLHPSDPHKAINCYRQALPLLATLQSELGISTVPTNTLPTISAASNTVFTQLREMWRWVERLMWRAVVLSAKTADVFEGDASISPDDSSASTPTPSDTTPTQISTTNDTKNTLWIWLGHYAALSTSWPPLFRAKHRSTVFTIHLRAFIIQLGGTLHHPVSPSSRTPRESSSSTTTSSSSTPTPSSTPRAKESVDNVNLDHEAILPHALAVVNTYKAVLSASTRFPKSGDKNVKVEEFIELCVLLWEVGWIYNRGGVDDKRNRPTEEDLGTSWVIEILQWAQTLTFNSSMILRHLTRLLYLSCPPATSYTKNTTASAHRKNTRADLAKRTLRLYVQVVSKAFEASQEGIGEDVDSDVRWVETLVFGARMLVADAAQGYQDQQAGLYNGSLVADVQEAAGILKKARTRLDTQDKRLTAEILLAEGVVWSVLGVVAQDPLTRPAHLHQAHVCLLQTIEAHPTPSAYYHLALSFARRVPPLAASTPTTAINSFPQPSPNHLKYAHTHSLTRALECAGQAVEGRPSNARYWHLLGLLLTAKEDWSGAREVLQRGAELDFGMEEDGEKDANDGDEASRERAEARVTETAPLLAPDFSASRPVRVESEINGISDDTDEDSSELTTPTIGATSPPYTNGIHVDRSPVTVLQVNERWLPPASTLFSYLHPSPISTHPKSQTTYQLTFDDYPPAPSQLFERHLQLRMTQVALMEVMDGPEGAEEGWLDVFSWVAEHNNIATATAKNTALYSSSRVPGTDDGHTKSEADFGGDPEPFNANQATGTKTGIYGGLAQRQSMVDLSHTGGNTLVVPIGITISPATPDIDGDDGEKQFPRVQNDLDEKSGAHDPEKKGKLSRIVSRISNVGHDDEKEKERDPSDRGRSSDVHSRQSTETKSKSKRSSSLTVNEKRDMPTTNGGAGSLPPRVKRSSSIERIGGDTSKSKKVQQMLKDRVHKSRAGISAVSRKIGGRNGVLRRANSTPDFHAVLQPTSYQASSIHSRRRLSSIVHSRDEHEQYTRAGTPLNGACSPTPPLPPNSAPAWTQEGRDFSGVSYPNTPSPGPTITTQSTAATVSTTDKARNARVDRLLSNLWLMSAATFRRLGKIEQARGAIQEAEMKDESNPNVWVQLGLYYVSLQYYQHAVDTLLKAYFIAPDDVAATVHLSRLYLDPKVTSKLHFSSSQTTPSRSNLFSFAQAPSTDQPPPTSHPPLSSTPSSTSIPSATTNESTPASSPEVDLAAGMLRYLTRARGWDVPEAWYFLSRAYEMQGREGNEPGHSTDTTLLQVALELSEGRGVRELSTALGLCL